MFIEEVKKGNVTPSSVYPHAREFVLQNWLPLFAAALMLFGTWAPFSLGVLLALFHYLGAEHGNEVCRILIPLLIVASLTTPIFAILVAAAVMHLCYASPSTEMSSLAAESSDGDSKSNQAGAASNFLRAGWFRMLDYSRSLVIRVPRQDSTSSSTSPSVSSVPPPVSVSLDKKVC